MDERDWLADRFEANRSHLRAVAYRMFGSVSEADDAVQEAWLRLSRAGGADVVIRVDRGAGRSLTIRGAETVARKARGRGRLRGVRFARRALVNGMPGFVAASAERRLAVAGFTVSHGKIVEIDLLADPERLRALDLTVLED